MPKDYEDVFRLRMRTEPTEEELQELEEFKKKSAKNKFAFLQNGKINLTKTDIKRIEEINEPKLEPVIPDN